VRAFSPQQRDLLISTRRAGFSQAALRDPSITRFVLLAEAGSWRCDAARHWSLQASRESQ
jgi:hypothetical protein